RAAGGRRLRVRLRRAAPRALPRVRVGASRRALRGGLRSAARALRGRGRARHLPARDPPRRGRRRVAVHRARPRPRVHRCAPPPPGGGGSLPAARPAHPGGLRGPPPLGQAALVGPARAHGALPPLRGLPQRARGRRPRRAPDDPVPAAPAGLSTSRAGGAGVRPHPVHPPRASPPRLPSSAPRTPPPAVPSAPRPLDIALAAAHAAAEYLRGLDRDGLAREYKTSHHDIVTEHDRASEEIIFSVLSRLLPTARIVGEEGGERPAEEPAAGSGDGEPVVSFYVDPIDGTS